MLKHKNVVIEALRRAFKVHESLGELGEEMVKKNQFEEMALKIDIEAEKAVLDYLKEINFPIRVISEEHGITEIGNPRYLGVLDGLDGSAMYKEGRGRKRYGTMFGIFNTLDPTYGDYLSSGIMEHGTARLCVASKERGISVMRGKTATPVHSSGRISLDHNVRIYVDENFEINKKTFLKKLKGFKTRCLSSSAAHYFDVASGAADLALECTRKGNLEIAIAYGLLSEAGGVIIDTNGDNLKDKKYREFGQKEHAPVIAAATKELAKNLLGHIKK